MKFDEYYKLYVFENRWENDRFLQDEEVAINKRENKYLFCLVDKSIFESALNDDNNLRLGSSIIFNYLIGN